MRARLVVLGAVAGCAGAPAAPRAPANVASRCIDPHHPGGTAISLAREGATGRFEDPEPLDQERIALAEAEEDGGAEDMITVGIGCGERPCDAQVVRRSGDGAELGKAMLPGTDGHGRVDVDWVSIDDDGGGARDLWTSYTIAGARRIAVLSIPDLVLRWSAPYGACDSQLHLVDADCDGALDLVLQGCGEPVVFVRTPDGRFEAAR